MDGGGNPPPQCYNKIKKPSGYRVNTLTDQILAKLISQGVATALFSSRCRKNFKNENKIPLLENC